jgi:2'-5' RNA ligase
MRLFTALDPPAVLRETLSTLQSASSFAVRWSPPEQFHITLRFIGEMDDAQVARVEAALADVDVPPVRCVPYGLDVLPARRSPRVLMLGLERTETMMALYDALSTVLEAEGLAPEERTYRPHITLGRLHTPDPEAVHRYLQAHPLAADARVGDERLRLDSDHVFPGEDHGLYPGDSFEVTDGTTTEVHTLAAKGDEAPVVSLERALGTGFAADETVFRPTVDQVEAEVAGVRGEFEGLGYDPTTFALPYDAGDARVWRAVAGTYDVLVDARVRSLPNPPGTPPLALSRYYLETSHMRMVEVETYLDEVAASGGLGVLAGHTAWETVPPERVAAVVDAAHARDIEVTTVSDAVQ